MSNYPPSSDPWSGEGERGPGEGASSAPPLASWGQRFAAWLVDALIGMAFVAVGYLLSPIAEAFVWVGYLARFGFVLWNLARQGTTGQTIGKGLLTIRLARLDGVTPPGVGLSIGRGILHFFVDRLPCYLGYLWPLWDEKRQTFADKIVNTVVVCA